jgi:glycine/sarcosine N-methyltransferase
MKDTVLSFYDALADHYHLIFDDWGKAIDRQVRTLQPLLATYAPAAHLKILDCACGIGTQALGLASTGHRVIASDISPAAVNRARQEASRRSLDVHFYVSDITSLKEVAEDKFDVVMAMDNALPHLNHPQLLRALRAIASKLERNGLFMASIRDYDKLMVERPLMQPPVFYGSQGTRRIVHQVWDWLDDSRYIVHLYITGRFQPESGAGWETHHFVSEYRCLLRDELSAALSSTGFQQIRWLMPFESGFYQPIVMAKSRGIPLATPAPV